MSDVGAPQDQQESAWLPPGPPPLIFDTFNGMNTKPSRPGVGDEECFWIDGFMPFGKNNLRAIWGVGPAIYRSPILGSIVLYQFGNIGLTQWMIVLHTTGAVDGVNVQNGAITHILPAGSITNPALGRFGVTQWGNQYLIIVADQPNGYWIWDGAELFTAGTLGPLVVMTNSGLNYTSQPTITAYGGSGSGATFTAQLLNGSVTGVTVDNPGAGYLVTDQVALRFTGGGSDDTATAAASVSASSGGVTGVQVITGGHGYSAQAYVTASGGGGTGATFALSGVSGTITQIAVTNPGTGYTSPPTIGVTDPAATPGTGFSGIATIALGQVFFVTVTSPGTGYTSPPSVIILGDGVGAQFNAQIDSTGGVINVQLVNGGQGYSFAVVAFSGGNNAADATIDLMPFGIQGTAAETYQSRVWVANQNKISFTAPESMVDFATSDGGGTIISSDSFLRNAFIQPVNTNGFLYLIADSSVNYISGVTTTGAPPTTTFTNQNGDPEIGTMWASAVDVFSRNIVFANSFGVHVSYGGAVAKVSDDLDGVYATAPVVGFFTPSSAKAIHFGIRIWMLLLPIVDPVTNVQVNKLLCWNGKKWFATGQDMPLTFINHQELNSVITAYGTDGTAVRPLFFQPSTGFTKTVQSKLWAGPGGYQLDKTATRLWALAQYYSADSPNLQVTIDAVDRTVGATSSTYVLTPPTPVPGPVATTPQAIGQQGALTGLTIQTNAADMSLVSVTMQDEIWDYAG